MKYGTTNIDQQSQEATALKKDIVALTKTITLLSRAYSKQQMDITVLLEHNLRLFTENTALKEEVSRLSAASVSEILSSTRLPSA